MKKLVVLVLAMLMAVSAVAYALPSKTTSDMTSISDVELLSTGQPAEGLEISVTEQEPVTAEIQKLAQYVTSSNASPVEYFDAATQTSITTLTSNMFDEGEVPAITDLELNECVALDVNNYDSSMGDIVTTVQFATQYKPGAKVIVLIGLYSGEKDADGNNVVEWLPIPGEVTDDGKVMIMFTSALMERMEAASSVAMMVLNKPGDIA